MQIWKQYLNRSYIWYRIFYRKKIMQRSTLSPTSSQLQETSDIFFKYAQGSASPFLPFKLYSKKDISKPTLKLKKRNTRGPYRKYSLDEKKTIIQRILGGETLKIIAEETLIPKRNLIRWKHEYLVEEKFELESCASQDIESYTDCKEVKSGSVFETKQVLSESSIKAVKTQE